MALFDVGQQHIPSSLLRDKYGWPPFSVLNTTAKEWLSRRDEWDALIGDSTLGRDVGWWNATPANIFSAKGSDMKEPNRVSSFDAYLTELMYRWFSLPGARILDPFAGGCVRGVVASVLGRHYDGIDLSSEQVNTDWQQFIDMTKKYSDIKGIPKWISGDADDVLDNIQTKYDMVFTCPPYYNLEKYTDDPNDLSNAPSYQEFLNKYANILYKSAKLLAPDSFFVIVVSEVREEAHNLEKSQYLGFVPDTINILKNQCSLLYYNDIILMNSLGSLPIRAPRYFEQTRKVGRHHQNILVFYKGDIRAIENKFGKVLA